MTTLHRQTGPRSVDPRAAQTTRSCSLLVACEQGTKRALVYALVGWVMLIGWALVMQTLEEFYVMAFLGGLVLGVS